MIPMNPQVIVVGGGIAGLTCAWRLTRDGYAVDLFEAAATAGGNVRSEYADGFLLEHGPHTFMSSADDVFQLAAELGIEKDIVASRPSAHNRFIARRGRLHAIPSGPWSFLTSRLLSPGGKMELVTDRWHIKGGTPADTATDFFVRRFGSEGARVLAGAFISGVYAGDPDRLSAPAAFPLFWGFEQEAGSMIRGALRYMKRRKAERLAMGIRPGERKGLYSFTRGLGQLTETLAGRLGTRIHTAEPVQGVAREGGGFTVRTALNRYPADRLVLAVPPDQAARLTREMDGELADSLASIPMAPVAVVYRGYDRRAAGVPDGFGFLAPRNEGIRTLGVLFPSRLFAGRTHHGGDLLTGYVGGMFDPEALQLDDPSLEKIVGTDLTALTGSADRAAFVRVARHPGAIPQFTLGHLDRMTRIHQRLAGIPGLFLAGNYLKGVGMKDAVRSGFEAAAHAAAANGVGASC
jgi:protoporphyrinogen/coproporphyrinogen III oxidase